MLYALHGPLGLIMSINKCVHNLYYFTDNIILFHLTYNIQFFNFATDLLEVCDTDKLKETTSTEISLYETKSEFEDDFALVTGKAKRKLKSTNNYLPKKKKKKSEHESFSNVSSEDENMSFNSDENNEQDCSGLSDENSSDSEISKNIESEEEDDSEKSLEGVDYSEEGDGGFESEDNEMGSNAEEKEEIEAGRPTLEKESSNVANKQKNSNGLWEDIYGRLRDEDGNIVHVSKFWFIDLSSTFALLI